VRQVQQDVVREGLPEQQRSFLAARRVGGPNASHPEPVVRAGQESLADLADALLAEYPVLARVLLVMEVTEVIEVTLEDCMELVAPPRDVAVT
jgi:hypothetical protein